MLTPEIMEQILLAASDGDTPEAILAWLAKNQIDFDSLDMLNDRLCKSFAGILMEYGPTGTVPFNVMMFGWTACAFQIGWEAAHKRGDGTWQPTI